MSETYVTEEEIGEALDLIEPEQSEATDPVPGTFLRNKEHPEDQRSSFLPPTVRNEEHLFLDVAALLDGNLPEPQGRESAYATTATHSTTPDNTTTCSAIPNQAKRCCVRLRKLRP
jgi:hypothetical protein